MGRSKSLVRRLCVWRYIRCFRRVSIVARFAQALCEAEDNHWWWHMAVPRRRQKPWRWRKLQLEHICLRCEALKAVPEDDLKIRGQVVYPAVIFYRKKDFERHKAFEREHPSRYGPRLVGR